ncbi:MAG TPA: hypothetical protein VG122_08855 [Gemmata sp.]|nr:hypothetical protein [Gemmata sp.]
MTSQPQEPLTQDPIPSPFIFPANRPDWTIRDCLIEKVLDLLAAKDIVYNEVDEPVIDLVTGTIVRGQKVATLTFKGTLSSDYLELMRFAKGIRC